MSEASLHLSDLIFSAVVIIALLNITALVCHKFKLPGIVGFIISGLIIGPNGFALIDSLPGANIISELAVVFLLFTIGMELSLRSLKKNWKLMVSLGLGQVVLTILVVVFLCNYLIEMSWSKSLLFGCIVSLSSSAIVMKLLIDNRELNSSYGVATTGILLTQDILIIPMTIGLSLLGATYAGNSAFSISYQQLLIILGQFTLAGAVVFVSAKYIVPHALERVVKTKSRELFFFAVLFVCLGFALIFEKLNLSLALGAFIAGLIVSESHFGIQATSEIMLLRASFLALFFVSTGMLLDLGFILHNVLYVLLFTCVTIVTKVSIGAFVAWLGRIPIRSALLTGMFIAQIGELSFVLVNIGLEKKFISEVNFQYFLAITVVTMIITPLVVRFAPRLVLAGGSQKYSTEGSGKELDVLVVGYGVAGQTLADYLEKDNKRFSVVELNYDLVKQGRKRGRDVVYGDGTMAKVLYETGLARAKVVVTCVAGIDTTSSIVRNILRWRPSATVVARVQYNREAEALKGLIKESMIIDAETLSSRRLVTKVKNLLQRECQKALSPP